MDDTEIAEIARQATSRAQLSYRDISFKTSGEIYPADTVPVMIETGEVLPMKWGFAFPGRKLLINARFETYTTKLTYKNARRCLIPASGYFEWKRDTNPKVKFAFSREDGLLLLAGLYQEKSDNLPPDFVILTREAVGSAADIHHRMPVIVPRERVSDWFSGTFMQDHSVTELDCREAEMPTGQIRLDL
jgi:putative SOS response-associated peptidase YedK